MNDFYSTVKSFPYLHFLPENFSNYFTRQNALYKTQAQMEVVLLVHICENSWVVGSLIASFYYGCLAIYLNEIWNETASLTKIHICQDTHYLLRFHESISIYLQILKWIFLIYNSFNPLSANPTEWSNTFKQFVSNSQWIVWVYLTILWDWRWKC